MLAREPVGEVLGGALDRSKARRVPSLQDSGVDDGSELLIREIADSTKLGLQSVGGFGDGGVEVIGQLLCVRSFRGRGSGPILCVAALERLDSMAARLVVNPVLDGSLFAWCQATLPFLLTAGYR